MFKINTLMIFCSLVCASASAGTYKASELLVKDYDEMSSVVTASVKKARKLGAAIDRGEVDEQEAISPLRESLQLIFSRPNSDNMIAKLVPEVRKELLNYNAFESVVATLVEDAVAVAKNSSAAPSQQSTAIFFLENVLAEIRPEVDRNGDLRRIVEEVRDAKIEVPKAVVNERKLNGMFSTQSPSEVADGILKALSVEEKTTKKKSKEK